MKRLFILFLLTSITSLAFAQCTFEKHIKFYPGSFSKTITTSDGCNVNVLGASYDSLNPSNHTDFGMCIVKLDACGSILWQAHNSFSNLGVGAIDVVEDDSENYILTGYVSGYTSSNNIMNAKYNKDGKLIWSKIYSNNTSANNIIKRKNRNRFVITGNYQNGSTNSKGYVLEIDINGTTVKASNLPCFDILKAFQKNDTSYLMLLAGDSLYLAQTDTLFNIIWKKSLSRDTSLRFYSYYDACFSHDGESIAVITTAYDTAHSSITVLLRIDLKDNHILYKDFTNAMSTNASPTAIISTSNNGYIIGPSMYYTDSNFNKIKYFQTNESFHSFVENSDRSITASGESLRSGQYIELYIVRTDALGNIYHAGISESQNTQNKFVTIFPNPSSGKIHIQTKNNETINTVKLFDFTGKEISITIPETHSTEITIDATNLKSGIYFMMINGVAHKILIE